MSFQEQPTKTVAPITSHQTQKQPRQSVPDPPATTSHRTKQTQQYKLHQYPQKRHVGATAQVGSLFKYDDEAWNEQVRDCERRRRKGSIGVPPEGVPMDISYDEESSEYNILKADRDEAEDRERRQSTMYQHTICRSAERASQEARARGQQLEQRADVLKNSKTLQRSLERTHMNFKNQESLKVNPSNMPKLNSHLAVNL